VNTPPDPQGTSAAHQGAGPQDGGRIVAGRAGPLPVLDALHSTPARRYLSTGPIPDEIIWVLLDAAVRGPTGGNQQGWGWMVVTGPQIKQPVASWYVEGWNAAYGRRREEILAVPPAAHGSAGRPSWPPNTWPGTLPTRRSGSSGAAQRGRGQQPPARCVDLWRGAEPHSGRPRPRHRDHADHAVTRHEDDVRELLGLPGDALTMGLLPPGYPARGRFGAAETATGAGRGALEPLGRHPPARRAPAAGT